METSDYSGGGGLMAMMGAFAFVYLAIFALILISMWKIFTRQAGLGSNHSYLQSYCFAGNCK